MLRHSVLALGAHDRWAGISSERTGCFALSGLEEGVFDAVPQGVALGWFVAAPFGAAGKPRNIKTGASG